MKPDHLIDDLIAQNAVKPRPGMEQPDHAILARVAKTRWLEVVDAQARLAQRREKKKCLNLR